MPDSRRQLVLDRLDGAAAVIDSLRSHIDEIESITSTIVDCLVKGGTIYTCGNGGSAAEALHLAEELIGRYRSSRRPLRGICLNADPTAMTCIANDFGFDEVFARQCRALINPGDLLVAFSTSGRSANVLRAIESTRAAGGQTIALLGSDGGSCAPLAEIALIVDSDDSGHIQEAHQIVLHIICEAVERAVSDDE